MYGQSAATQVLLLGFRGLGARLRIVCGCRARRPNAPLHRSADHGRPTALFHPTRCWIALLECAVGMRLQASVKRAELQYEHQVKMQQLQDTKEQLRRRPRPLPPPAA